MQHRSKRVGPYCRSQFSTLFLVLSALPSRFYEKFSVREVRKKNELQVCALNHNRAIYNFSIAHWDDRLKLIEKRNLAKEDGFRQRHFKIDIKIVPHFARSKLNLVEISTFPLNNFIVCLTKIMNRVVKNWAHFYKIKYFKNQSFQRI